ncbi:hypothetical protein [Nitrospira sp. BLG_2]|uniref:hypothetical protein n=1 Tax=Nitrospira sp. BLG_2 TaxID=3397507 RepID=UPI003B9AF803
MQITLDQDHWEVDAPLTMVNVLTEVSERAHARSRIVTKLQLDHRTITDRDLDPAFLAESVARFRQLTAVSQPVPELIRAAEGSISKYAETLRTEGSALLSALRFGRAPLSALDAWLGQLADYLEFVDGASATMQAGTGVSTLTPWVQQLLEARTDQDQIRLADLLEYEILPRLDARG